MSEIKRTGKSKGGGGRRMGINITLHKQVVFMTSLCSLYYNFSAENIFIYFTQRPRFRDVYSVYSVYRVSRESRAGRAAVSWPSQTAVSHASTIS